MTVRVRYFAVLRERAGREVDDVSIEVATATPAAIYAQEDQRYRFGIEASIVRAAVNGRYIPWDAPLTDGDEVVFIPPVSGG
ncbi:MAG: MoaD/ThiS family protein [Spirochaeta sp.]|jgi:molybdopterin converting factor subunit 1|nr:MoaD/ThiS family protein [Spirochaeta sp.]